MKRFGRRLVALLLLTAAFAPAAAAAAQSVVGFESLGYPDDIASPGVYPAATFYLPRYRSLRSLALDLDLDVAPLADPRSSVAVTVGGQPVWETSVAAIRKHNHVHIALPLASTIADPLAIGVRGHLFITGDVCSDLASQSLFMTIHPTSHFTVQTSDDPTDIRSFFRSYENHVDVVTPSGNDEASRAAIALPYRVRQLEPWHDVQLALVGAAGSATRTIVVRPGSAALERTANVLTVAPQQVAALRAESTALLFDARASGVTAGAAAGAPSQRVALSELGIPNDTRTGVGDIPFEVPLSSNRIGGIPKDLHFHLGFTHTPLLEHTTGMLQIQANGTLIAARELSQSGTTEEMDVAVPSRLVGTENDLRVVASYYVGPGSCSGSLPALTGTLSNASYFSWSGLDRQPNDVSDFVKILSGNVAILVSDERFTHAAFRFMDELGRVNKRVRDITVQKFDGSVPSGYDFALVFAPPESLARLGLPVHADAATFRIVNPLDQRNLFVSTQNRSIGIVQVGAASGTPTLAFTYFHGADGLAGLERLSGADLLRQVGNVAFVADDITSYEVGPKLHVVYEGDDLATKVWFWARIPIGLALLGAIVFVVMFASRRLTGRNAA